MFLVIRGPVLTKKIYSYFGHRLRDGRGDPKFAPYQPRIGCDVVHDCSQATDHHGRR